ncbi:hypothetical protein [Kerstersia sp.]|uniref:hypothetical protein n=1 Tax=Kerstersia sp. TaxID=1930783 RepID=UPI003F8DA994
MMQEKRVAYLNSRLGPGPEALTGGTAPLAENVYLYDLEAGSGKGAEKTSEKALGMAHGAALGEALGAACGAALDTPADAARDAAPKMGGAARLASLHVLLIPANADQRFLMTLQPQLEQWLLAGGTMVINGHVAYPFLRWLLPFEVQPCPGLAGLQVARAAPHPVFDGVDPAHLTYRRGVAGFYARGANPPPPGALVLNTLGPGQQPIDWLLVLPGGGRLLVHSGNDLWMYANGQDSAARIVPQLFDWLASGETA